MTERIYWAKRNTELPSMTRLSWLLLDKDKRANVEDVWQTAHLVNIASMLFLMQATLPST